MTDVARVWGQNIRAQRSMLQISQQELADTVGVSQGTVSKWERGDAQPSHYHIPKIARALSTVPAVLFPWPQDATEEVSA